MMTLIIMLIGGRFNLVVWLEVMGIRKRLEWQE